MQHSIVKYTELFTHEDYRWDGEYLCFEPHKNSKLMYLPIGDVLIQSQYGISIAMNEDGNGTKIYRMNEIANMFCDRNVNKHARITQEEIDAFKLIDRDVLFNRTNSQVFVGRTGIFKEFSKNDFVFASYLIRLKPDESKVLPEYLTAFLNTKYGVLDVKRRARVSINQSNVNAEELKRVEIPLIDSELQKQIKNAFDKAFVLINQSEAIYKESESLLLSELGLLEWRPKHCLSFVRKYSETEQAGRFDAEYFQPKYDEIVKAMKKYKGGWDTLGNLVSVKKCVEVGSGEYQDEGIPFVRVSNLSTFEVTEEKYISEKLYSEIKQHQPKQGEILFSKDATPGIAYYLRHKPGKIIPSGGILRLKRKDDRIKEDYLTLVLNSLLTKEQINRDVGGSVILHWRPDQVRKTLIPILPEEIQRQIQQKVTESFALRKQSKYLLECAKKAVETAIEKDEKAAMQWLKKQTKNCTGLA